MMGTLFFLRRGKCQITYCPCPATRWVRLKWGDSRRIGTNLFVLFVCGVHHRAFEKRRDIFKEGGFLEG